MDKHTTATAQDTEFANDDILEMVDYFKAITAKREAKASGETHGGTQTASDTVSTNNTTTTSGRKTSLLPYAIIAMAAEGDTDSMNIVLRHFGDYIAVLATVRLYDGYGNPYLCVDESLKRRLETKLITAILTFNVA